MCFIELISYNNGRYKRKWNAHPGMFFHATHDSLSIYQERNKNMYQHKLQKDIRCPLEYGLEIFGGKWKSRILCVLAEKETLRYSELRKEMSNITDAVLSSTLKELIADDIVLRKSYDEIPPRVEYHLSEKGTSIIPILQSICRWAGAYHRDESGLILPQCQKCDYLSGR